MTKTREFVSHAERAYLQLAARREMKLREAAEEKGETWIGSTKFQKLEAGIEVKLKFFSKDGNPRQELYVKPGELNFEETSRAAEELLGGEPGPAVLFSDGVYVYTRKSS